MTVSVLSRGILLAALWFFSTCCVAFGLEDAGGLIGLLKLPRLFGSGACGLRSGPPVPLYADPTLTHPIGHLDVVEGENSLTCTGTVVKAFVWSRDAAELPTLEYAYEAPAAIVKSLQKDSYEISIAGVHRAWLRRADAGEYLPIRRLLPGQLLYLTEYALISQELWNVSVELISTQQRDGQLWLHLRVPMEEPCTQVKQVRAGEKLLVRFHGLQGRPSVWFYSRGC